MSEKALQQLTDWDPASEAFQNRTFNSYSTPNYDANFLEKYTVPEGYVY